MQLECSESARKQRTALYESDQSINQSMCLMPGVQKCTMVNQSINQSTNQSISRSVCLMIGVQHREGESVDSLLVLI